MIESRVRFAQPVDLQDGLEPVVLTRTRDIAVWSGGGFGVRMFASIFRSPAAAVGTLLYVLVCVVGMLWVRKHWGYWAGWLVPVAVWFAVLFAGAGVLQARNWWMGPRAPSEPARSRAAPQSVQVDVEHPDPAARLRVIGEGSDVAALVAATLTSQTAARWRAQSTMHHAFANLTQIGELPDQPGAAKFTYSAMTSPWRTLLQLGIALALVYGVTMAALSVFAWMGDPPRDGVFMLLAVVISLIGVATSMYPTVIDVGPGRIDVIERGMFGQGVLRCTTYDLRTCRVTIELRGGVFVVEDPGKTTRGTFTYVARRLHGELGDLLRAARTGGLAPQPGTVMPANPVPV